MSAPVLASRVPMALALGQQQQLAQAATLEHLKERLERGAAADCPEKKMLQLAEEQQRLMQQALQQNLLALASHFNPMNLRLNNGHGEPPFPALLTLSPPRCWFIDGFPLPAESKQALSMNITTNGAASINVSVEINGTVYTGGLHLVPPRWKHTFNTFNLIIHAH